MPRNVWQGLMPPLTCCANSFISLVEAGSLHGFGASTPLNSISFASRSRNGVHKLRHSPKVLALKHGTGIDTKSLRFREVGGAFCVSLVQRIEARKAEDLMPGKLG